jgi:hypothetical protein
MKLYSIDAIGVDVLIFGYPTCETQVMGQLGEAEFGGTVALSNVAAENTVATKFSTVGGEMSQLKSL